MTAYGITGTGERSDEPADNSPHFLDEATFVVPPFLFCVFRVFHKPPSLFLD